MENNNEENKTYKKVICRLPPESEREGSANSGPKRLYLSASDYKIAGVCGGIAEYFNVDSVLVRIIYILIDIATGVVPGVIAYLLAWAIMPRKPEDQGKI